jgi:hypothetical protein
MRRSDAASGRGFLSQYGFGPGPAELGAAPAALGAAPAELGAGPPAADA